MAVSELHGRPLKTRKTSINGTYVKYGEIEMIRSGEYREGLSTIVDVISGHLFPLPVSVPAVLAMT
jgi:hypothetical protein